MKAKFQRNIPDFFIVGAAKAGTTSLWYYLGQHKHIFMTKDIRFKELCLYSDDYGLDDLCRYSEFFRNAKDSQLIGEACHAYLTSPESAEKIKYANHDAKIIISLRNPVDRAYSLYNWMKSEGYEDAKTFVSAIKEEEKRFKDPYFIRNRKYNIYHRNYFYLNTGLYYEQVKRYYEVFGARNCYTFIFEEFVKNTRVELSEILSFLGLSSHDFIYSMEPQNTSYDVKSVTMQFFLKNNFDYFVHRSFIPARLANFIKINLFNLNRRKRKPKALSESLKNELKNFFISDVRKTEELIGKDLSLWFK